MRDQKNINEGDSKHKRKTKSMSSFKDSPLLSHLVIKRKTHSVCNFDSKINETVPIKKSLQRKLVNTDSLQEFIRKLKQKFPVENSEEHIQISLRKEGLGTIYYKNGDIYTGNIRNTLRHGNGRLQTDAKIYFGNWTNNLKTGDFLVFSLDTGESLQIKYQNDSIANTETLHTPLNNSFRKPSSSAFKSKKAPTFRKLPTKLSWKERLSRKVALLRWFSYKSSQKLLKKRFFPFQQSEILIYVYN